jgi:hypothetical protein
VQGAHLFFPRQPDHQVGPIDSDSGHQSLLED